MIRTVGVDLAAQADRTALCVLRWSNATMSIERMQVGADDAAVVAAARSAECTGIDAPFGWPDAFVEFVSADRTDRGGLPVWSAEQRDRLRFRRTDVVVREVTGRWPLSVSSDLIAVTAFRCAGLLRQLGVTDRSGGRVVEVYPAAALARWGLPARGYKGSAATPQRWALVQQLEAAAPFLQLSAEQRDLLIASDHAFDALIAALVARCVVDGLTLAPAAEDRAVAAREGWIVIPDAQALSRLTVRFGAGG